MFDKSKNLLSSIGVRGENTFGTPKSANSFAE